MGEPAIILFLRAALPDWTVGRDEHGNPFATHLDGSRFEWRRKYRGGSDLWIADCNKASHRRHEAEFEFVTGLEASLHQPTHTEAT